MAILYPSDAELLRTEIAIAAARLIAEDGADYSTAKRKAARQILGNAPPRGNYLPDNAQIEEEVRQYNELFFGESQPARLLQLRLLAIEVMDDLAEFNPYLTGAVLNGTAGEHSDIHLQLFAENTKDVTIAMLNRSIDFEVSETSHFRRPDRQVEVLSFLWKREGVHLALYEPDDLRGAMKTTQGRGIERANVRAVRNLIEQTTT